MDGHISKILKNSATDGPGIRTTVLAVGCPLKCLWCPNPELIGEASKFLYHPKRCVGCGLCVAGSGGEPECYYDAYEQSGGVISEKELAIQLLCDKPIFESTGGGVTYSGGDAAMQSEFFCEVTRLLKNSDVHIALDTAGYFPWEKIVSLVAAVDLIIYSIKTLNRGLHNRYTSVDNKLILENALRIADMQKDMIIRMIIIPGVNDSDDEITGRLKFVKSLGKKAKVEIVKYKKYDTQKYASLAMLEMMEGTKDCPDMLADQVRNIAQNMGIEVVS